METKTEAACGAAQENYFNKLVFLFRIRIVYLVIVSLGLFGSLLVMGYSQAMSIFFFLLFLTLFGMNPYPSQ